MVSTLFFSSMLYWTTGMNFMYDFVKAELHYLVFYAGLTISKHVWFYFGIEVSIPKNIQLLQNEKKNTFFAEQSLN